MSVHQHQYSYRQHGDLLAEVERKWSQVYFDLLEFRELIIRTPVSSGPITISFEESSPMAKALCILFHDFISDFNQKAFDGPIVEYFVIKYDVFNQLLDLAEKSWAPDRLDDQFLPFLARLFRALLRGIPPAAFLNDRLQRATKRIVRIVEPIESAREKLLRDIVQFVILREPRTATVFYDLQPSIAALLLKEWESDLGDSLLVPLVVTTSYFDEINPEAEELLHQLALQMALRLGKSFVDEVDDEWRSSFDTICLIATGNPDRAFSSLLFNLTREHFLNRVFTVTLQNALKGPSIENLVVRLLSIYEELSLHDVTICLFSKLLKALCKSPPSNFMSTSSVDDIMERLYTAAILEPSLRGILVSKRSNPLADTWKAHETRIAGFIGLATRLMPMLAHNRQVFNQLYKIHLAISETIVADSLIFVDLNSEPLLKRLFEKYLDADRLRQVGMNFLPGFRLVCAVLASINPKSFFEYLQNYHQLIKAHVFKDNADESIDIEALDILLERHLRLDSLDISTWYNFENLAPQGLHRYILFHFLLRLSALVQVRAARSHVYLT